ncbi:hypothetical protein [Pseudobacteriovorax antillogorgiicola]|uniref:Lipocalin-like domain-containing protein n=1 Tax=Pseudobacteriovorax antillogorgiicola TaxID=1513793 RepID=A0A1Y6BPV9_9BACT|nr:hypothetical protein [Pseudobacteriovorax antillogorgiicola]TCS53709.1 hypothetical protein EDD56_10718 [Pseudobacteriovorax antillogorgiicola]SMF22951.1 hypothetical protein SAMN06296036_107254 [Pseudobacteriovorax antillogorgiicola]
MKRTTLAASICLSSLTMVFESAIANDLGLEIQPPPALDAREIYTPTDLHSKIVGRWKSNCFGPNDYGEYIMGILEFTSEEIIYVDTGFYKRSDCSERNNEKVISNDEGDFVSRFVIEKPGRGGSEFIYGVTFEFNWIDLDIEPVTSYNVLRYDHEKDSLEIGFTGPDLVKNIDLVYHDIYPLFLKDQAYIRWNGSLPD